MGRRGAPTRVVRVIDDPRALTGRQAAGHRQDATGVIAIDLANRHLCNPENDALVALSMFTRDTFGELK